MMVYKLLNWFSTIVLTLFVFIFIVTFYMFFIENNPPFQHAPIEFNSPITTDKVVYQAGENVILHVDACRYVESSYTLYRSFRDGLIFQMPQIERASGPKGCFNVNVPIEIPKALPSGKYYLYGHSIYHVNILADRDVTWETETFYVQGGK